MPGAYWIAHITVTDPEAHGAYAKAAGPAFDKFGGKILARGTRYVTLEGRERGRHVVIWFPSVEQAEACYHSPEYQAALALTNGTSERDLVVVEAAE
ncbi:DUF1330 domain-containing protein [Sinirhodobacter populi]|uniref:DUF1330 domain-containing protein n=1 Tax=Paenirhodobacter populi TaxID=2306993 RepID=A0A443KQE9_9RHOB|nr:DUF1330 domain-containing protein [Sinirhodobacter populi]RWR35211.1 DUF1330 domain-containing protein [Sinirhodobacter populi]